MTAARKLLAATPAGGGAAPEFVQSKAAKASTVTLDATPTDGSLLVVCTGGTTDPATFSSLTSAGYALHVSHAAFGWRSAIFSKVASSDGATVTVTEGLGSRPNIVVMEFNQGLAVDETDTSDTSSTSLALGPTASLAASAGVAVATVQFSNSTTDQSFSDSFVPVWTGALNEGAAAYSILASSAAVSTTASWTTSRIAVGCLAAFT